MRVEGEPEQRGGELLHDALLGEESGVAWIRIWVSGFRLRVEG